MTGAISVVVKVDDLSQLHKDLIDRIMNAVELPDYTVTNIKYYRLDKATQVCVAFGNQAASAIKLQIEPSKLIELPPLDQLFNKPENERTRAKAYHSLKDLSHYVKLVTVQTSSQTLSPDQLPPFTAAELISIKKDLIDKNISGFSAINQEGRTVRIKVDDSDNGDEDINIHISELITLRMAIEIFNLKEISIIVKESKGG